MHQDDGIGAAGFTFLPLATIRPQYEEIHGRGRLWNFDFGHERAARLIGKSHPYLRSNPIVGTRNLRVKPRVETTGDAQQQNDQADDAPDDNALPPFTGPSFDLIKSVWLVAQSAAPLGIAIIDSATFKSSVELR